jgi:hypothetical protein
MKFKLVENAARSNISLEALAMLVENSQYS